jgi:putative Mg2+ transporter-C (MgtC) family protein
MMPLAQVFLVADWIATVDLALLGRLLLAAVLGGVVGFEREMSGKPAGLRTNLLICVGAALLMELSIEVAALANMENVAQGVEFRADPARIAAQIVSGIGFLGAGTILQARGHVIGLTTAATIWVVAAIGMAVGAQAYVIAIGSTALVFVSLAVLARVEGMVEQRWGSHRYAVTMEPRATVLALVEDAFRTAELHLITHSIDKANDHYEVIFYVTGPSKQHEKVVRSLVERDDIHRISRVV